MAFKTTGKFETREELEQFILKVWLKGPDWKRGRLFLQDLSDDAGVSILTIRRIIEDHKDK